LEGAQYQKFFELRVRKNYWVQIGVCRDVGHIVREYPLKCVNQKSCSENFLTPSGIGQKKFSETTFRKFNTHKYEKRRFT
jgi:hypothetical protein